VRARPSWQPSRARLRPTAGHNRTRT
jgi:hypothetical protein